MDLFVCTITRLVGGVKVDRVGLPDHEDEDGHRLERRDREEQGVRPVATGLGKEETGEEGGKRGRDGRRRVGHAQHDGRVLRRKILVAAEQAGADEGGETEGDREETNNQSDGLVGDSLNRGGVDDETNGGERDGADTKAERLRALTDLGAGELLLRLELARERGDDRRHDDGGQVRKDGEEGRLGKSHSHGAGEEGRQPREQTIGEIVPGEVGDGERPELRVANKGAPRNGETLLSVRSARGFLHVGRVVSHVGNEPPGAPDEAEGTEEVKDGGPAAEVEDDRRGNQQTSQGTDVETAKGSGNSLGALARRHTLGQDTGRGRRGDTLTETNQEAGREKRRHAERRAPRRDEGTKTPKHDTPEQHSLTAVFARQPPTGDLGERIAPEERRRNQTLLRRRPPETLRHRDDGDGHVHLVEVTQDKGDEERENHAPALLLTALAHIEHFFLRRVVRVDLHRPSPGASDHRGGRSQCLLGRLETRRGSRNPAADRAGHRMHRRRRRRRAHRPGARTAANNTGIPPRRLGRRRLGRRPRRRRRRRRRRHHDVVQIKDPSSSAVGGVEIPSFRPGESVVHEQRPGIETDVVGRSVCVRRRLPRAAACVRVRVSPAAHASVRSSVRPVVRSSGCAGKRDSTTTRRLDDSTTTRRLGTRRPTCLHRVAPPPSEEEGKKEEGKERIIKEKSNKNHKITYTTTNKYTTTNEVHDALGFFFLFF